MAATGPAPQLIAMAMCLLATGSCHSPSWKPLSHPVRALCSPPHALADPLGIKETQATKARALPVYSRES